MFMMKTIFHSLAALASCVLISTGAVTFDDDVFGERLGGWRKRDHQAAEYPQSGATYRTYKPEISPTPDGGVFISVRIDHVRGWLSSDDHATLEVTVNAIGRIESAQSNIAIQGRSVSSDLIVGSNESGKVISGPTDRAVQIGTDLVADLSAKMLREKIVEAGRVSFPAVLRHNYNLLFQAIRLNGKKVPSGSPPVAKPVSPSGDPVKPETPPEAVKEPAKEPAKVPGKPETGNAPLEVKPYGAPSNL